MVVYKFRLEAENMRELIKQLSEDSRVENKEEIMATAAIMDKFADYVEAGMPTIEADINEFTE